MIDIFKVKIGLLPELMNVTKIFSNLSKNRTPCEQIRN